MAKLIEGPNEIRCILARQHGNSRQVLVPIAAITAITEGVKGDCEHKSAIYFGAPHPIRLSEPFDEIASTFLGAPLDVEP